MLFWSPGSNISLWATFSSWTRMIFLSNVYNRRFSCDISFTNFSVKAFVCPFHKYCMHPNPLVLSLSEAQAVFMVPKTPKSLIWCLPPSSSHHPPLPVPEMEPIIPLDASLHQGWCQAGSAQDPGAQIRTLLPVEPGPTLLWLPPCVNSHPHFPQRSVTAGVCLVSRRNE